MHLAQQAMYAGRPLVPTGLTQKSEDKHTCIRVHLWLSAGPSVALPDNCGCWKVTRVSETDPDPRFAGLARRDDPGPKPTPWGVLRGGLGAGIVPPRQPCETGVWVVRDVLVEQKSPETCVTFLHPHLPGRATEGPA